jgi:hypothetical protein
MVNDVSDTDGEGLLSENHQVDLVINLEGLAFDVAISYVNSAIKDAKAKNLSKIWFSFGFAQGAGKQTLFMPIGKLLRDKLKTNEITRAMPSSSGGWIVRIK